VAHLKFIANFVQASIRIYATTSVLDQLIIGVIRQRLAVDLQKVESRTGVELLLRRYVAAPCHENVARKRHPLSLLCRLCILLFALGSPVVVGDVTDSSVYWFAFNEKFGLIY